MTSGDKIKVLIVDDIAETRENIRRLLQFENDIEVVGAEGNGRAGITAAKDLRPDVVLMDINMPDIDGITATELIRQDNPATQIVILSVQGDPNYMRRAMLAGARDFLTKPPAVDELTSAIRRAGKMARDERQKVVAPQPGVADRSGKGVASSGLGNLILVYSPKGGAGATTVAVNLAIALKEKDKSIALVDGNLQFGDIAVFLNEQVRLSILDLAPRADELDNEIVNEVMIEHAATGIKVMAAPTRPEYAENVTGEQFAKVLKYLQRMFQYVIVDGSSTLTDVILAAMDVSDLVVLVTAQDIPSIKNARLYLDLADGLGVERRRILFVMNKYDKRIGITPEKVGDSFKHQIVAVFPVDERVVLPAVNRGIPFMMADRTTPIAKGVLSLAELVQERISELSEVDSVEVVAGLRR